MTAQREHVAYSPRGTPDLCRVLFDTLKYPVTKRQVKRVIKGELSLGVIYYVHTQIYSLKSCVVNPGGYFLIWPIRGCAARRTGYGFLPLCPKQGI